MHRAVSVENDHLNITLGSGSGVRSAPFDSVLDLDDFGEPIGLEILGFRSQLGALPPPGPTDGLPRWSYDKDEDAFYVRVSDGTAPRQKTSRGSASFDRRGAVVSLRVVL